MNNITMNQTNNAGVRVNRITKAVASAIAISTLFAAGASACAPKSSSSTSLGVANPRIQALLARAHGLVSEPDLIGLPQGEPSIVGMWTSSVVAGGQVVDMGFEQWTSDGLQVLNDMSPILAGNICYGTWVKTAPYTYKLNHPTFLYDDSGVNVIAIGYIRATITLAKNGKTYTGKTTFLAYDLSGNVMIPEGDALDLIGERLGVDTTVGATAQGRFPNSNGVTVASLRQSTEPNRKADTRVEGSN